MNTAIVIRKLGSLRYKRAQVGNLATEVPRARQLTVREEGGWAVLRPGAHPLF